MGGFKKAARTEGLCEQEITEFVTTSDKSGKAKTSGICGDPLEEPIPEYIGTGTDNVLKNNNNAWIILGRDRPASRCSGYGGRGDTQAGAIDIVVGRMGSDVIGCDEPGNKIWAQPDFRKDAARIYISQKTDVDANFGLAAGQVGTSMGISEDENTYYEQNVIPSVMKVTPRSAIALKADGIRLIAREGIKLVTRTDSKNSQGGGVQSILGIDLIAGNDDTNLQPMVLGTNLELALTNMVNYMDQLAGVMNTMLHHQSIFNTELATHFHFSPFQSQPTTLSPSCDSAGMATLINHLSQVKRSLVFYKTNMTTFAETYLTQKGKLYINSRYNNTN